jgi:hypothetical protein
MLIRFITTEIHGRSRVAAGIFVAAYRLRDSDKLPFYDHETLTEALRWFEFYLKRPYRFSRTMRPRQPVAISWFKSTATDHISKIWEMVAVLENNEVPVRLIKTVTPGYIVYEDEHQIVAEPYAEMCLWFR